MIKKILPFRSSNKSPCPLRRKLDELDLIVVDHPGKSLFCITGRTPSLVETCG